MTRKRKTYTQKEGGRQADTQSGPHISEPFGLASQPKNPHPKEDIHLFLRALARELARADHSHDG
jgi:hypothetical protein